MSRIFHLMNLSQRYHGTKGYLETQQEEPPLGQSGVPCLPGGECFAPNHQGSSKSIKNHSRLSLVTPRHHLNDPWLILRKSFFHHFSRFWSKLVRVSLVPVIAREWRWYHRNLRWKSWGSMSRIFHLMNLSQRYHGSKGSLECRQEEPPLGILAPPGDLEESASQFFSWSADLQSVCLDCSFVEALASLNGSVEASSVETRLALQN